MTIFIIALILLGLSLFGIAIRKTYNYLPEKELKRQARSGDAVARVLYSAVAYGPSLRVLLGTFIFVTAAAGFVLFARIAPPMLAFFAVLALLAYGFGWMPAARVSDLAARLVVAITPFVTWLLNYVHPLFYKIAHFVEKRRPFTGHSRLYEREDLVELLVAQRQLPDNRIAPEELDIAVHALTFGDRLVGDITVPRRVVKMVSITDKIGPILMGELHESGHSRFPVYDNREGSQDNLVGILYLRDLVDVKHGGNVEELVQKKVYYVHEDQSLYQVLHAFITTKHHLFVVVNSFEEFVGIVTIEDVLEQVIGRQIVDEFDAYDDMRAVARSIAAKEHDTHKSVSDTVTEVVE